MTLHYINVFGDWNHFPLPLSHARSQIFTAFAMKMLLLDEMAWISC